MSFGRAQDPGLDDLIVYVIERAVDRGAAPTKTKLVKLLYLADVARARDKRRRLTDLRWVFFHYGPYAFDLEQNLDRLVGNRIEARGGDDAVLYVRAWDPPDSSAWPDSTRLLVDRVVDEWSAEPLNALLDYVYFETEPMVAAKRGQELDFDLVKARSLARPDPGLIKPAVREKLRALALARSREQQPAAAGRLDAVWEKAMAHEAELDDKPLIGLVGTTFRFGDEAARALADEGE